MNPLKGLLGILKHGGKVPPESKFNGKYGANRARAVLSQCPIINGEESIIDRLLACGELQTFKKGEDVIIEGDIEDDSVFFLLLGDTNVFVNGKIREDIQRSAPFTVGEMKAIEPSQKRTATIRVASDRLVTLKVPGSELRELSDDNTEFKKRIQADINKRGRQAIAATGIKQITNGWRWTCVSALVGISTAGIVWWILNEGQNSFAISTTIAVLAGIMLFIFMLFSDPAYRYFRLGTLCVGALLFNEALKWQVEGSFLGIEFAYRALANSRENFAIEIITPVIFGSLSAFFIWLDAKSR